MHVLSRCSGSDSDVMIPFLPCSGSQPVDSNCLLMDRLGTKHRVWLNGFELVFARSDEFTYRISTSHYVVNLRYRPHYSINKDLCYTPQNHSTVTTIIKI